MLRLFLLLLLFVPSLCLAQSNLEEYEAYTPIPINHGVGDTVQFLKVDWSSESIDFLDERHVVRYSDHTVWTAPPGKYLLNVKGEFVIVNIVGNVPTPDPDPPTSHPFGNLRLKVAEWTQGKSVNTALGRLYIEAADKLGADSSFGVATSVTWIKTEREKIPGYSDSEYSLFRNELTKDMTPRWVMPRTDLIKYYREIAIGLGVSL